MFGIDDALIGGAVAGLGSLFGSNSASDAAKASAKAQLQMYNQTRADLAPYRDAGTGALSTYQNALGLNGSPAQTQFWNNLYQDPQFTQATNYGLQGVQRSAAANGKLFSGGTLKALQDYGQNAYYGYGQNYLGQLSGLAGMGQSAAAQTGTFGANAANGASSATANAGALAGQGISGAANALAGGINNANVMGIYNNYLQSQLGKSSGSSYASNSLGPVATSIF